MAAVILRPLCPDDANAASALVLASFERFIGPDWEPHANARFAGECDTTHLRAMIGNAALSVGAFDGDRLRGVALMTTSRVLRLMFVSPESTRQGIGRLLWEACRQHAESATLAVQTIELNSSPHALPFYRSVGFVPLSREFVRGGCRATRMACWLPARALAAEP